MNWLNLIALIILALYALLMMYSAIGFAWSPVVELSNNQNKTKVSVIIPAHNEEPNIKKCIHSIIEQDYDTSLLEIVIVNDASTDNTFEEINMACKNYDGHVVIVKNDKQLGKKQCLAIGIAKSEGDLIITRDADTWTENKLWLKSIVSFYEDTKKEFIICPVQIAPFGGFIRMLQNFENLALTIVGGGFALQKKAFLCNGANLAFARGVFDSVNGYKSHLNLASGDDIFLLEDVKKQKPQTVAYLKHKNASVLTNGPKNLSHLILQKTRWAGKFKINRNPVNFLVAFCVVLSHCFTLFYLLKLPFTPYLGSFGLFFILSRLLIDFLLLFLASRFYGKRSEWLWFLPVNLVYTPYTIVVALCAIFYKPKW